MKIQNMSLSKREKSVTLSADVAFKGHKPERMYFSTDLKNEAYISTDYSPFLAAVLLPCMKRGEDIIINGKVSKKLLENTEKIMDLVESWNIGLKKIKITCHSGIDPESQGILKQVQDDKRSVQHDKPNRAGVFFSAGVDSFYTYLKHKNKKDKISALILIHGFDIPLRNNQFFQTTKNAVEKIANEEDIKAISVETNGGEIIEKYLIWDFSHGGALVSVALFLRKKLDNVYISGGLRKDEIFPYGTHPELDKLWSTGNMNIVHDGTEYNRLGKVLNSISKSPLALKYLRVCPQNIKGKYNCSRCYKCLQTMIELVCANAFDRAKTFDKLDLGAVRNMYYDYSLLYNLQGEANLKVLKSQNRELELQRAIEASLIKSKKRKLSKSVFKTLAAFDRKYNSRRLYRLVFQINKDQDRNMVFKFLGKIGALK